MRNFFKGGEVPSVPEPVAPSESVTPPEDVVGSKEESIDHSADSVELEKDLDEIEKQIAAVELAAVPTVEKENNDKVRREELFQEINDMVSGNRKLARLEDRFPSIQKESYKQHEKYIQEYHETEEYKTLLQSKEKLMALRERLSKLRSLNNFKSPLKLSVIEKKIIHLDDDCRTKILFQYDIIHKKMKPWDDHTDQQKSISSDPAKFAIEAVRAANPEEFDRLFPDIKYLASRIGIDRKYH